MTRSYPDRPNEADTTEQTHTEATNRQVEELRVVEQALQGVLYVNDRVSSRVATQERSPALCASMCARGLSCLRPGCTGAAGQGTHQDSYVIDRTQACSRKTKRKSCRCRAQLSACTALYRENLAVRKHCTTVMRYDREKSSAVSHKHAMGYTCISMNLSPRGEDSFVEVLALQ